MPAPTNVKVTFTGDTSSLTSAAATANKALVSTGAAADAADKKLKALPATASAFDGATDRIGKFGGATGKAAAFLSVLSPSLADAARNAGDLADGAELAAELLEAASASAGAVATAAGVLVVALAAAATAYAVLGNAAATSENMERAAAVAMLESQDAADKLAASLTKVAEAHRQTSSVYSDNSVKIALLSGALEQYEVDAMAAAQAVKDGTAAERDALRESLRLTDERLSAANKVEASESALADERAIAIVAQGEMGEASKGLRMSLEELNTTTDTQAGIVSDLIIKKGQQAQADKDAATAATRSAKAQQSAAADVQAADEAASASAAARAAGEQRLQEFIQARAAAEQDYADGVASLRDMESEANSDRLTEIEALGQARADQMAALNAMVKEQLAAAEGNELKQAEIEQAGRDARLAIEQRYQRDKGEIVAEGNAAIAEENAAALSDLAEKETAKIDKIKATLEFAQSYAEQVIGAATDVLDSIAASAGAAFADAQQATMDAFDQVRELGGLIDDLGLTTVDAAALSGEALVEAYKSGKVSAEELSDAQKKQIAAQLENEKQAAAEQAKMQQEAAMQAWQAQHDAAVATAALNIPVAISQALSAAPFPFNLILAAAAGALAVKAAADVAASPPPSFRSGYMPDQQLAMIEPQSEMVVPAAGVQAMGGMAAARGAFAGVSPAGGQSVTRFYIGHKGFSAMASDSAGRPGPLRDLTVRPSGRINPYTRNTG